MQATSFMGVGSRWDIERKSQGLSRLLMERERISIRPAAILLVLFLYVPEGSALASSEQPSDPIARITSETMDILGEYRQALEAFKKEASSGDEEKLAILREHFQLTSEARKLAVRALDEAIAERPAHNRNLKAARDLIDQIFEDLRGLTEPCLSRGVVNRGKSGLTGSKRRSPKGSNARMSDSKNLLSPLRHRERSPLVGRSPASTLDNPGSLTDPEVGGSAESASSVLAPLGVPLELDPDSPPSGAVQAELLFEEPYGGSKSLLLAVFPSGTPNPEELGPILPMSQALEKISTLLGLVVASRENTGNPVLWSPEGVIHYPDSQGKMPGFRSTDGGPPWYVDLSGLSGESFKGNKSKGYLCVNSKSISQNGQESEIEIPWADSQSVYFRYDPQSGLYVRLHKGHPLVDPTSNLPFTASNVVLVGYPSQGNVCWIHAAGRVAQSHLSSTGSLLITSDGKPYHLRPGRTWILCPSGSLQFQDIPRLVDEDGGHRRKLALPAVEAKADDVPKL